MKIVHCVKFLLVFGMLCSLFSCSKPTPAPVEAVVIPTPFPEPEVDNTFSTKETVEAWRTEFAKIVEERAALPSPEKIFLYAKDFKVDPTEPDPFIGDPTVWNANWMYSPASYVTPEEAKKKKPNVEEAKALEAANRHWDAAKIWIELGKMEDAKRCSQKLVKKGEWKAVALIAVLTGDLTTLSSATTKMVKAGQVSRTQDVVHFAFEKDKMNAAKHICNTHGWQLENVLSENEIRALARRGDPSLRPSLIQRGFKNWEAKQYDRDSDGLVADIVTFAKSNPKEAKLYASRYLNLPQANVLIWVSCGEGCYNTPIRGSLELYQLIKKDPSLREIYFERTRQFINEAFPLTQGDISIEVSRMIAGEHAGKMAGWSTDMWGGNTSSSYEGGNLLFTYLWHVRRLNDPVLKAFWVQMLDTFGNRHGMDGALVFEREFGRFLLGLPVNMKAEGLTTEQKVVLDVFQGRPAPDPVSLWKNRAVASKEELEKMPTAQWLFTFLSRGDVSPAREAQIRRELGLEPLVSDQHLRYTLRYKLEQLIHTDRDELHWLETGLEKPQDALWTNVRAQQERSDRGLPAIDLYPDTEQEFQELIAPSLVILGEKLPGMYKSYKESKELVPIRSPSK